MNCGFEDCRILDNFLDKYHNLNLCFENFSKTRKPNGDGVQDLSMHNFIVMRDKTADPAFYCKRKLKKNSLIHIQKNGPPCIPWLVLQIFLTLMLGKLG